MIKERFWLPCPMQNNITIGIRQSYWKTLSILQSSYIEFHYKNRIRKLPSLLNKDCTFDARLNHPKLVGVGCCEYLSILWLIYHIYFLSTVAVEVWMVEPHFSKWQWRSCMYWAVLFVSSCFQTPTVMTTKIVLPALMIDSSSVAADGVL